MYSGGILILTMNGVGGGMLFIVVFYYFIDRLTGDRVEHTNYS